MRRRPLSLLVIATAFSLSAEAQPPPATAPTTATAKSKAVLPRVLADAMTKKARDLYLEGTDAMAKGQIAEARAAFVGAWALEQHYSIACNLGDAELRLGRPREAADRLALCVREIDKDAKATEAERGSVKKLFADARSRIVQVVVRGPEGGEPAELTAFVDGAALGQVPPDVTTYLDPGKHVITLVAQGYDDQRVEIDGAAGAREEVRAALKRKAVATASATATATAPPPPERSRVPALVLGGVSLASLVAGGALLGVSVSDGAALRADAPRGSNGELLCRKEPQPPSSASATCDAWRSRAAGASTLGNAGIGLLVVGGVAAAGAVAAWLFWPESTAQAGPASQVQFVPVVGTGGGGVVMTGNF